jgi:hypothetical protein
MMTDAQRIAELEREVGELRLKLASMPQSPAPSPPEQRQVTISTPTPHVAMPTDGELYRLLAIVCEWNFEDDQAGGRRPLGWAPDEIPLAEFRGAFRFVQAHGRLSQPDHARSLGWWVSECRNWINRCGGGPVVSDMALVCAVIATGDVPFTHPGKPGFAIGLQFGGGGVPAKDWWRRVLGGAVLDPSPPAHAAPMRSPVTQQLAAGWRRGSPAV